MAKFKVQIRNSTVFPERVEDRIIDFEGTLEELRLHSHIISAEEIGETPKIKVTTEEDALPQEGAPLPVEPKKKTRPTKK